MVCVWRHDDQSICGHLEAHHLHGDLDYADHPDVGLRKSLVKHAVERPRARGVRHVFTPGTVQAV
jgi:hypothetical protein